jgi:hypothetical protein
MEKKVRTFDNATTYTKKPTKKETKGSKKERLVIMNQVLWGILIAP